MKFFLIVLMFFWIPSNAQNDNVQDLTPQEIIDEVNNGIDDINCGLQDLSNQAEEILQQEVDAINQKIKDILEQYDLECLYNMLDVSFSGLFDIDFSVPSVCEIASDYLNKDQGFLKTQDGALLKLQLDRANKNKRKFKSNVKNNW